LKIGGNQDLGSIRSDANSVSKTASKYVSYTHHLGLVMGQGHSMPCIKEGSPYLQDSLSMGLVCMQSQHRGACARREGRVGGASPLEDIT
jgi:hypothetical protein